jgi:hypothetical protein
MVSRNCPELKCPADQDYWLFIRACWSLAGEMTKPKAATGKGFHIYF